MISYQHNIGANVSEKIVELNTKIKIQNNIKKLCEIRDNHKIWNNPLLLSIKNGSFSFSDWQYLFSQYYLYSKNFTRFLSALMVNCENDLHRSELSKNLWEEGGGTELENRHAEIFRKFLINHLNIKSPESIVYESYTHEFYNEYFNLCLHSTTLESAAALSFGTESIVPRLYTIIRDGLKKLDLSNDALLFFELHIDCDDDHAESIEKIVLSYANDIDWYEKCKNAMVHALDIRDIFFKKIYDKLQNKKLNSLIEKASKKQRYDYNISDNLNKNLYDISFTGNSLYKNKDINADISFEVERFPFDSDVLDARLVRIAPGRTNEFHSHAHETIFLILEGTGNVIIEEQSFLIKAGNVIHVPRWLSHQTQNTGEKELKIFAVTDYGFTKCFPDNTESCYRKVG